MAAAEYYGTTGAHELSGNHPPHVYPPQAQPKPQQYQQPPTLQYHQPHMSASYSNTPPPSYTPYANPPQQRPQAYPQPTPPFPQQQYRPPQDTLPYPTSPPPVNSNTYLSAPLQPIRSHSQPPRVHFADQDSDLSDSDSYSDSDDSTRRRRHQHRRRKHRSSDYDRKYDRKYDRDLNSSSRHHHHSENPTQRKEHKDRDTFLGAGAGALVGDAIFPGLGTAAGILLGGLGGRKYARRSRSEDGYGYEHGEGRDRRRDGRDKRREYDDYEDEREYGGSGRRRRAGEKGWDEKSATLRVGGW